MKYHSLWTICDNLRANSNLKENEYCMPVLGVIFLKYIYLSFKEAEKEINKNRPSRDGRTLPADEHDFKKIGVIQLPEQAQYKWILSLPLNVASKNIVGESSKRPLNSLGEVLNNAMSLIEERSPRLYGVLYKEYNELSDSILRRLLETFDSENIDNDADSLGEIYEYFLGEFSQEVKSREGIFFTPKSLVKMIVNVLDPVKGTVLDPACGSGGMFVQIKNYLDKQNMNCSKLMSFYGHEKVSYNAKLCVMNISIHKLQGDVKGGEDANTYYNDPHNLNEKCDYVLSNPPFNVDAISVSGVKAAGRLPFGIPPFNKKKQTISTSDSNFLWASYFYSYLNERGKAGFVMPSIAMNSKNNWFRKKIVETKHMDILISVPSKFFQSKFKGPCSLWFFNKQKSPIWENKVLFIDASDYYVPINSEQNTWSEWQLKNLSAIVWLYRGNKQKYLDLLQEYKREMDNFIEKFDIKVEDNDYLGAFENFREELIKCSDITLSKAPKKERKKVKEALAEKQSDLENGIALAKEYYWIYSKFGEGEYKDILGLCKATDVQEIREKNYSLTPGIYVGVVEKEKEDEGVFMKRMEDMHRELADLEKESHELMVRIQRNMELWKK